MKSLRPAVFTLALCLVSFISYCHSFVFTNRILLKAHFKRKVSLQASFDCDVVRCTQIFCNVELNCESIQAVGFDMDYTLAQYNKEFDLLAFNGSKQKLVDNFNYPEEVLRLQYEPERFRRGLIIDKTTGNILKVDRHKYPRLVKHGLKELNSTERKELYTNNMITFDESNYVNIDTLFLLIDAMLFMDLVDMKDRNSTLLPQSYAQIYSDIRACVEECHKDGTIKDIVMNAPGKYIIDDPDTVPMLQQLKQAGKKVFLLTNSLMDFTDAVMNYIVHANGANKDLSWRDLFDVVIVGACKPAFLTSDSLSIFHVDRKNHLQNVENKSKLRFLLEPMKMETSVKPIRKTLKKGVIKKEEKLNTFQGGNWKDLHQLLDVKVGHDILYVGDHMYSDILRSKKNLGWRTCLIIPELDNELEVAETEIKLAREIEQLRLLQLEKDDERDTLLKKIRNGEDLNDELAEVNKAGTEIRKEMSQLGDQYNQKFNKFWGPLFKSGRQDSRFARQIMDYACLYTSRASNFLSVDPNRPFRAGPDFMPHERDTFDTKRQKVT